MGSTSHRITPLVINNLGGRHTHTQTRIPMIADKAILRNQMHAGHKPGLQINNIRGDNII